MKRLLYILICGGGLAACATPQEKTAPPPSAVELATAGLGLDAPAGPAPAALVPELPPAEPLALPRSINQRGGLPAIGGTAPPPPPVPAAPAGQDVVTLDYEQVELRQVLQEIGDVLGLSMVVDPAIGDKVTMRTAEDKPLHHADLWPLVQLLISDAGITMEKKGQVYHLKKLPTPLPLEIGGPGSGLEHSQSPEVMQITPLRYVTTEAALTAIRPLVEPQGRVISLPTLNLIGMATSPDRLRRVNQLLALLDADPFTHRGIRLFRLNNGKAADIQADLDKILKAVEGNMPAYQVIALERINSLLVVAPPSRGFEQVAQWVEILDERNEEGGEQVFIYRVRNLKATTLAGTLSEVFQLEDDTNVPKRPQAEPKAPSPQAGQENPLQPPPPLTPPKTAATIPEGGAVSAALKVNIVADEDTNTLLVRARPRDYRQLLETIARLDQVPKEVMVNVVVAEVSLTEQTRFGIDWSYWFGNRGFVGTNFGLQGATRKNPVTGDTDYSTFGFGNLSGMVVSQVGNRITSMLNLLAADNDVQVLSRPSLLVRNNQEATINVGSDQPTITRINTQSAVDTTGNLLASNEVQYRQTGIILKVTPHINEDGIVNMDIAQEVSQVSKNAGVEGLPAFDQRKIETSVVVRDGSAIVLGGLIETRATNDLSGIPGLREVPVVSPLFSSQGRDLKRTELVVFIVPQIIDPQGDNHRFVENFIHTRMKSISAVLNGLIAPMASPFQALPAGEGQP